MQESLKLQAWKHVNPVRNALPRRYRAVANKLIQVVLAEGQKCGAPRCARRAKLEASYYMHRSRPELKNNHACIRIQVWQNRRKGIMKLNDKHLSSQIVLEWSCGHLKGKGTYDSRSAR